MSARAMDTLIPTVTSTFETEAGGRTVRVEFSQVPHAPHPFEVTTIVTGGDGEPEVTHVGFGEYFSAKQHYLHAITRAVGNYGVRG